VESLISAVWAKSDAGSGAGEKGRKATRQEGLRRTRGQERAERAEVIMPAVLLMIRLSCTSPSCPLQDSHSPRAR
jgi:hypothetical protein